jgi:LuxR family maltose regulon positive regulatory protein
MAAPPLAKLTRPRLRDVLPRPRVFRLLDAGRPLTWVWGPPGAGKTALLAGYLGARRGRHVWYRCDAGDGDAASFLGYLARAAGLRAAPAGPAREALRALFARLRAPFALVLDGYHEIPADSPVHEVVAEAVAQLPPGGRVFVASRAEPPAAFARLRASRAVGEVGWPALRLSQAETRALVRRLAPGLSARLLARLHERAAGWAAGVVLLLQERRGLADERRWAPDGIVDYFANEILARADADTRQLLLETAFLPRISGAMAEALTGRPHAGRLLARLHRQSCFTVQHAAPHAVYEYHPLFRAFLRRRAHAVLPVARRVELRRGAAALLEREGQVDAAAALLREAGDWEALAGLVEARAAALIAEGRGATLDEWIAALAAEALRARPWALFWRAVRRLATDPAGARTDAATALPLFREAGDAAGAFLAWALAVETFPWEQEDFAPLDDWIARFEALVEQFPMFPSAVVETRVAAAMVLALLCRQPQHRQIKMWARRALELAETAADPALKAQVTFYVLLYDLWTGDLDSAGVLAGDLRILARAPEVPALGRVAAGLGLARFEWLSGDFAAARASVDTALAAGRAAGLPVFRHTLMGEAVMTALTSGDRAAAHRWLTEIRRDLPHLNPVARAQYHYIAGLDALLAGNVGAALGEHEAVLAAAWQCGMPTLQCLAHLFAAEALGAAGAAGADVHLAQAVDLAHQLDSALLKFMALLTEADLARRRGDEGRAVQTLALALPLGREHGYVNTWLWQPRQMAELAVLALDADIEPDYVRRLVRERALVPAEAPVEVETWPWPVKVFTLGRFEVLTDERPVRFAGKAQKKPLALLQALVAMGGQRVREERLTEALWPDAEGDAAHQALSTTLHRLRRLVGHERAILRHDGAISLVPEHCWVDLWAIERMVTRAEAAIARSPVRDHEWASSVRWTERAVALYRGEFLAGDPALPWAAGVGERLRERLLRQLRKLGHLWESMGDWEEAAQCYEHAVAINECAEEFYRRLMVAYQRLDRRGDAVLAYQRCRKHLSSVLGIGPSVDTEALARSIQAPDC